jgi:hypothetical protein
MTLAFASTKCRDGFCRNALLWVHEMLDLDHFAQTDPKSKKGLV